jgi:hypothetical protein
MARGPGPARGEEGIISNSFTTAERERFHNLLKLAADSPFEGERANALAAAGRLAARHGMTLEEAAARPAVPRGRAASSETAPSEADPIETGPFETGPFQTEHRWTASDMARFVHLMDWQIHAAKQRREEALREARKRGLDAEDSAPPPPKSAPRSNRAWRNPRDHARVLLTETSLRLHEIVEITGLDIYQVAGFKLKLQRGL